MNWSHTPRLQLTRAGMAGVMVAFVSMIALPVFSRPAASSGTAGDPQREEHIAAHDTALADTALPGDTSADQPVTTEQGELPRSVGVKVIRGIVVDQQGKPIAGAELWYAYANDSLTWTDLEVHATSDADGKFALEIPPLPDEKAGAISAMFSDVWTYSPGHSLGRLPSTVRLHRGRSRTCALCCPRQQTLHSSYSIQAVGPCPRHKSNLASTTVERALTACLLA